MARREPFRREDCLFEPKSFVVGKCALSLSLHSFSRFIVSKLVSSKFEVEREREVAKEHAIQLQSASFLFLTVVLSLFLSHSEKVSYTLRLAMPFLSLSYERKISFASK